MARVICGSCKTSFLYSIIKGMEACPVCGKPLWDDTEDTEKVDNSDADKQSAEERADWITWYYYKDEETQCFTLRDEPIDLEKWTDTKLIKEFKAPPRDSSGSSEKAKEILRTYVPDAFKESQETPKVKCPYCFSGEIQIVPRKFSLLTGFATNKFDRVCLSCKRKF